MFQIFADLVELNSLKFHLNFVETFRTEFLSENFLNITLLSATVFYRFNNRVHRYKNIQCLFLIIFIIIEELTRPADIKTGYLELNILKKLTMN